MTKDLTILLLTRALTRHRYGGLELHTEHLARGLAEAGANVHVITTRWDNCSFDKEYWKKRESTTRSGIPVHHIRCGKPGGYAIGTFGALHRLAQSLAPREGRVVIHAQGFAGFAARPRRPNQRFVVTVHGTLWSETPLWRGHWERLDWRGRAAALWRMKHRLPVVPLWRRMLRRADRLIVDSEFTRRELVRENGEGLAGKVSLVPLGVPPDEFPHRDKPNAREILRKAFVKKSSGDWNKFLTTPLFLSVGRLHRMKGLHILLDALAPLHERSWRLIIAGDGPERATLEAQAAALQLSDHVIFTGRVADADLPQFYAGADVFVNPELGQPAFGLVALEAQLQGTPVIANRVGALPEVIGDGGTLIDSPDAESWRAVLADWLDHQRWAAFNPSLLRAAALQRCSFDGMIQGTLQAYGRAFQ